MTRPRPVARRARDERPESPAEEITALLAELHDGVETRESIVTHRRVRRGPREVAVPDIRTYRTRAPGLLAQLGVVADRADTAPVEVYRWEPDPGDKCLDRCPHGRWVLDRTEQRGIPGMVTAGAAVPGGSAGWDADGALAPLTAGGKPGAAEPVTETWHTGDEIREELAALGEQLHTEGWRPPATLVTIALDDPETGAWIASRLRALISRARIAAQYDAPIVPLRDIHCRYCGGQLHVRQDASSAVWCSGRLPLHGPPTADDPDRVPYGWASCGARWPRGAWVKLLEDAEPWEPPAPPTATLKPALKRDPEPTPGVLAGLTYEPTDAERSAS